ncbi:hypothetical protein F511_21081 [Dorcoceras hygrometricum]|uniref:Uncharacterized protein n=1 Tax=Dorcoceras hygrometricum TaxID=472368 RepID=A0A2Z7CGR9_9LAMI|nr:hypothetical protein F511_21081 [Dorcoceras hygrometricum]
MLDVRGSFGLLLRSSFILYHSWELLLAGSKIVKCFVWPCVRCAGLNQNSRDTCYGNRCTELRYGLSLLQRECCLRDSAAGLSFDCWLGFQLSLLVLSVEPSLAAVSWCEVYIYLKTWSSTGLTDSILSDIFSRLLFFALNPRALFIVSFSGEFPSFPATILDIRGSFGLLLRISFILYHSWELMLAGSLNQNSQDSCCGNRCTELSCNKLTSVPQFSVQQLLQQIATMTSRAHRSTTCSTTTQGRCLRTPHQLQENVRKQYPNKASQQEESNATILTLIGAVYRRQSKKIRSLTQLTLTQLTAESSSSIQNAVVPTNPNDDVLAPATESTLSHH